MLEILLGMNCAVIVVVGQNPARSDSIDVRCACPSHVMQMKYHVGQSLHHTNNWSQPWLAIYFAMPFGKHPDSNRDKLYHLPWACPRHFWVLQGSTASLISASHCLSSHISLDKSNKKTLLQTAERVSLPCLFGTWGHTENREVNKEAASLVVKY